MDMKKYGTKKAAGSISSPAINIGTMLGHCRRAFVGMMIGYIALTSAGCLLGGVSEIAGGNNAGSIVPEQAFGQTPEVDYDFSNVIVGGALRVGGDETQQFDNDETYPNGIAAIGNTLYMVGDSNDTLYELDTNTGAANRIGNATQFGIIGSKFAAKGLTSIGDALYMVASGSGNLAGLYTIDTATSVATRIGSTTNFDITEPDILFFTPSSLVAFDDTLYLGAIVITTRSTTTSRLYRFNVDDDGNFDGSATRVGTSDGFGVNEQTARGLAAIGDTLYMTGSTTDALYTVDAATGIATRVGNTIRFDAREPFPIGLATIGNTLYMIGSGGDALYVIRHE